MAPQMLQSIGYPIQPRLFRHYFQITTKMFSPGFASLLDNTPYLNIDGDGFVIPDPAKPRKKPFDLSIDTSKSIHLSATFMLGSPRTPLAQGIMLDSPFAKSPKVIRGFGGYYSPKVNVKVELPKPLPPPTPIIKQQVELPQKRQLKANVFKKRVKDAFMRKNLQFSKHDETLKEAPMKVNEDPSELDQALKQALEQPFQNGDPFDWSLQYQDFGQNMDLFGEFQSTTVEPIMLEQRQAEIIAMPTMPIASLDFELDKGKQFVCPFSQICDQQFSRKHDLLRHIRIHTNEKAYRCERCFKAFTRLDALKRHMQVSEKYGGQCRAKRGRVPKTVSQNALDA